MKGMAQVFVQSGAFPAADNMAKVMVKMQAGRELGMQPVQAIQSMYFVHGKLGMYGQALLALMKKNGLKVKWTEMSAEKVTGEFSAEGQDPVTISFGKEDQQRAKLGGDNYSKYPQDMYVARCVSRAAKLFPELVGAPVETVEVLQDIGPTEALQAPVDSPAPAIEAPLPAKLQTPQEKKEEKRVEKQVAKAAEETDEDKAMMADPRVAEIVEEMNVAETDDDAEGVRQMIVNQSWSVPQAQWLGSKFSAMKDRIRGEVNIPVEEEVVDTAEAAAEVFGDAPAAPEEKVDYDTRCEQLTKMKSVDLKPILDKYGIDYKGMNKDARMLAILAHEYPESAGQTQIPQQKDVPPPPESPNDGAEVAAAPQQEQTSAPASNPFLEKLFKAGK